MRRALPLRACISQSSEWQNEAVTFAHVGAAADRTAVLRPIRVDSTTKLEQPRRVELSRVGHDLFKQILQPF